MGPDGNDQRSRSNRYIGLFLTGSVFAAFVGFATGRIDAAILAAIGFCIVQLFARLGGHGRFDGDGGFGADGDGGGGD